MTHINKLMTISGTAATEQHYAIALENFLVNIVGWERTYKYSDTTSVRAYGYTSDGEYSERERMRLYYYTNCQSNYINQAVYTWLTGEEEGGAGSTNACFNSTENRVQTSSATFDFWVMANRDVVYVMIRRHDNNTRHMGGAGYLKTPYSFKEDPLPAFAMGQNSTSDTVFNTRRVRAYNTHSYFTNYTEGVAGGPFMDPTTTNSGGSSDFLGLGNTSLNTYYGPSQKQNGRLLATPITLYRPYTDSLITCEGIRGYLPHMWTIYGHVSREIGGYITTSGLNTFTGEIEKDSTFIIMDELNAVDNTQIIGPIQNFDLLGHSVPYTVGDGGRFQLWLSSYYYSMRHNNNYFDHNGYVSNWRDQHFHPNSTFADLASRNDAPQAVAANQPRTVQGVTAFNDNPVVRFTSADSSNVGATVLISNDITIFAVASYSNGANRTPIINIRGDVSAVDTLFSLEFNENNSNSATAIMAGGGGTDREEFGSLSAGTAYILTATVSGNDTTLYVNGDATGSSTITNTKAAVAAGNYTLNYSVGVNKVSGGGNGTVFSDADISEVMVYRQALTEEDKQTIVCMLGDRYNITVSGTC